MIVASFENEIKNRTKKLDLLDWSVDTVIWHSRHTLKRLILSQKELPIFNGELFITVYYLSKLDQVQQTHMPCSIKLDKNFTSCPVSAGHILKLERYRED